MKNNPKLAVWLISALLLVAISVAMLFTFFWQLKNAADMRQHTFVVLNNSHNLISTLRGAETDLRGYLLTGDETFLQPFKDVRESVELQLKQLHQLAIIPAAQAHLNRLTPLIETKLSSMERLIELARYDQVSTATTEISSADSRQIMNAFRAEMNNFIKIEEAAFKQYDSTFQSQMRRLFAIITFTSLFVLLFAMTFVYFVYRNSQQQIKNLVHLETKQLLDSQEALNEQLQQAYSIVQEREETLLEEGALQRAIFNSANFSSIATDAKGVIQIFNVGAERMLGYKAADVMNKVTPADISDPLEVIARAATLSIELETSITPGFEALVFKASRGIEDIYELTYIRKDGSRLPAVVSVTALRDAQEAIIGYLLIGTDNTARKQVEEEQKKLDQRLRDQQFYTRSLIESNIDALMTTDPAGIISDVNRQMEELTGCTRDELIGAPFKNYFTNPERAEAGIKRVLKENKVTNYELTARARDGKQTDVSYNATTFYDRDRNLQGVFAAARDVTERKRLDRILEENNVELEMAKSVAEKANLAKSDFLSSMSHELRTPLSAILGFAQLIDSGNPPPSPIQKRSLNQILQAGWYLLDLINEILDLALIESGKLSLSMEPVSLADVMQECATMIEPEAQKRGINVSFPHFDILYTVHADHTRVKQVLINLLSNAIKYNSADGTVVLTCKEHSPGRIRITVADNGEGLSPEKIAQLFQPFNRLGQESNAIEGTGIGLVMTKRLIELMGGAIGLDSVVGKGSIFWIEMNLTSEKAGTNESEFVYHQQPEPVPGTALRTLLYVEDNPANLMLVEDLIARRRDLHLLTARDGNSGVALARKTLPDLILMDINLPGISGIQALKLLRADPTTLHIPVVAVSANAIPRDIEKGLQAGFFRYLTKPINVKEFMQTLDVALTFVDTPKLKSPKDESKN